MVKSALYELYNDYVVVFKSGSTSENQSQSSLSYEISQSEYVGDKNFKKPMFVLKEKFKKHKMETIVGGSTRSELDIYLSETIVEEEENFDVLRW